MMVAYVCVLSRCMYLEIVARSVIVHVAACGFRPRSRRGMARYRRIAELV